MWNRATLAQHREIPRVPEEKTERITTMKADQIIKNAKIFTAEHEGFSNNKPRDIYIFGKKLN